MKKALNYFSFISLITTFGLSAASFSNESCKIRFSAGHSSMKSGADVINDLRRAKKSGMACFGLGCQMQQVAGESGVLDEFTPLQVGKDGNWNIFLTPIDNGGFSIEPVDLYPDEARNIQTNSVKFVGEKNKAIEHFNTFMRPKLQEIAQKEGKSYQQKVDELASKTAMNQLILYSKFGKDGYGSDIARKEMLSVGYARLIEATWGAIAKRSESMLKGKCQEVEVQMTCPSPDRQQSAFDERYKSSQLPYLIKDDARFQHLKYQPGKAQEIINKKIGSQEGQAPFFQCGKTITLNLNDIESMKKADPKFFSAESLMDFWKKKDRSFPSFPAPSPTPSPTPSPPPVSHCTSVFKKYFSKSLENEEKLKKFIVLQSKLTLNKIGWAYSFHKKLDPTKNFESTIRQLLKELQDPNLQDIIKEFENAPFTIKEFRKVAPIVFEILNRQQDWKNTNKIFLLNLTDLKMIDILIERERQLGQKNLYDLSALVESTLGKQEDPTYGDQKVLEMRMVDIYSEIIKISEEISNELKKIAKKCRVSINGQDVCIHAKDYAKSLFDPSPLQDALFHTVMSQLENEKSTKKKK